MYGPNVCSSSCDCDGNRFCVRGANTKFGFCQGVARLARRQTYDTCPKGTDWYVNEANNPQGPNTCFDDCDCDGNRYCDHTTSPTFGYCQGDSGHYWLAKDIHADRGIFSKSHVGHRIPSQNGSVSSQETHARARTHCAHARSTQHACTHACYARSLARAVMSICTHVRVRTNTL